MFLPEELVRRTVEDAIARRRQLEILYVHVGGDEGVDHLVAPFDIGSTNPATAIKNQHTLYAYAYTHRNKLGALAPRVVSFDARRVVALEESGTEFDPADLAERHRIATGYDYRDCEFALLPNRGWFE